jgi:formate dehydrogenase assembly factor FdhD
VLSLSNKLNYGFLLAENYTGDPVRIIHVTITNLVDENNMQLSLFRDEADTTRNNLAKNDGCNKEKIRQEQLITRYR